MTQPLVSIALSAYNVEQYIADSLDCIVNQSLKNIEIICMDDGSKDDTLLIINEYAKKDNRITVISKPKNEGLAVARNQALQLAKGKYVCFVDGDDLMDLSLFEKAYLLAEKEQADMVIWDYAIFYNEKDLKINKTYKSTLTNNLKKDKISLLKRPAFTWVKLLKTEKVKELKIYFPKGLTRQDIPVHWHLITALDNISILQERLSFYRQQPQATTARTDSRLFDLATVMDITKDYLLKNNLYQTYKNTFLESQLNLLAGMFDKADKILLSKVEIIIEKRLETDQWDYINSSLPLRNTARSLYKGMNGSSYHRIKLSTFKILRSIYRKIK